MNTATASPKTVKTGGAIWTLPLLVFAVCLTGRPEPDALALFQHFGFDDRAARIGVFIAPALLTVIILYATRVLARGWPLLARLGVFGLGGLVIGMMIGRSLELFAGLGDMLGRVEGGWRDATFVDAAAWSLAAASFMWGLVVLAVGVGGTPAARALADEVAEPDCIEVRKRERGPTTLAGIGLMAQGLLVAAVASAHMLLAASDGAALILACLFAVALVLNIAIGIVMWRGLDEFQRRMVMDAYGISAIVATILGAIYAVFEGLKLAPPLSAYATMVFLLIVQTLTASVASAAAMSETKGARG